MHLFTPASLALAALASLALAPVASAEPGRFVYQGRLFDGGAPVDQPVDVTYALFDAASGGSQVGSTLSFNGQAVTDGLFSNVLDFGDGAFDGGDRWLEITVDGITLGRQRVEAAPYASFALNAPFQTIGGDTFWEGGTFGIGTPLPLTKLHVEREFIGVDAGDVDANIDVLVESTDAQLALYSDAAGTTGSALILGELIGGDLANTWTIRRETTSGGNELQFNFTDIGKVLGLLPNGNVGIGVETPVTPLHVDGQIRASGDGAQLTVFNPNNQGASTIFGFQDNVARWRVGGSGPGANGGWDFQRVGDQSVMRILDNGRVGIGTTSPFAKFQVDGAGPVGRFNSQSGSSSTSAVLGSVSTADGPAFEAYSYGDGIAATVIQDNDQTDVTSLYVSTRSTGYAAEVRSITPAAQFPAMLVTTQAANAGLAAMQVVNLGNGHGGVFVADPLNTNGDGVRGIARGTGAGVYGVADVGQGYGVYAQSTNGGTPLRANRSGAPGGGDIAIFQYAGINRARIDDFGTGYFNGGIELSGADMAEAFAVEGDRDAYGPGDVLAISRDTDRTMTLSGEAYCTLVAGVYATRPGVLLSERGIDEPADDLVPMGVVGVIPTKVSGENGPIRRGDLLVTSSLPGHAMRGTDRERMLGAILGKALEDFDGEGTGVIKVMVNVR